MALLPYKELHEVVKAIEICKADDGGCNRCPYYKDKVAMCLPNNGNQMLNDAYYYLRKYQRNWLGLNVTRERGSSETL